MALKRQWKEFLILLPETPLVERVPNTLAGAPTGGKSSQYSCRRPNLPDKLAGRAAATPSPWTNVPAVRVPSPPLDKRAGGKSS